MERKKRVGLYLDPKTVLRNPGYLEALQKAVGLNLIILSYTGQLSQDVLALNPFDGAPPSDQRIRALITRDIYGRVIATSLEPAQISLGPHMGRHGDDKELSAAMQEIHSKGIEVWLLGGGWQGSDYKLLGYCPSKEENNRWYEAVFAYMARSYGAEGVDVTHARYAMTSEPAGLWACACPDCAHTAGELGYDMGQMVADIKAAYARLRHIDGQRLVDALGTGMGFFDLMQVLGLRAGVWQWFEFRARLLARNLKRFRDTVHATAGRDFVFGSDTYPASQSMFVGHDHSHWSEFSDFASPLLSHADIFCTKPMHDWARFLLRLYPRISERDALQVIYRLLGYDNLGMPSNLAGFALDAPDREYRNIPLVDVIVRDMAKARLYLGDDIPSYPIIQGGGAPSDWPRQIIDALIAGAAQWGHDGVIFQGTNALVDYRVCK
jgi:hypothetical protein